MRSTENESARPVSTSRRTFLRRAAGVAGAATLTGLSPKLASSGVLGANDRVGIGFIGAGGRASGHMRVLHQMKNEMKAPIEFVAVCDVYRARLEKARKTYNIARGYMDHRELLADPRVDLVCIATPDHHHGYQVIDAVRAGKDVYCEKPVTHWRQFDLTRQLAAEVKKSDRVFQLGTQAMSDSAWHQMKRLVKEGLIGKPVFGETGFFRVGDWGERGMSLDDPMAKPGKDLNWEAFLGDAPRRPFDASRYFRWRLYEDYAGGPVTDLYPHCLTQVVDILGVSFPQTVVATGGIHRYDYEFREVPDTFNMIAEYPEKVTISVLGTQANDHNATGRRGSGKRVPVIRGWDGTLTIEGEEIVFTPVRGASREPQRLAIEHGESLTAHWQNLLDACRSRCQKTFSPVGLACHVQTALIMASWALREGKVAKFDAEKQEVIL